MVLSAIDFDFICTKWSVLSSRTGQLYNKLTVGFHSLIRHNPSIKLLYKYYCDVWSWNKIKINRFPPSYIFVPGSSQFQNVGFFYLHWALCVDTAGAVDHCMTASKGKAKGMVKISFWSLGVEKEDVKAKARPYWFFLIPEVCPC